ncbi:MAG TPA: hypothetical protein VHK45_00590 [Geminicoccaceae bacterium]|nr:hypothetical protein [Geminicoccaceae bacterium]
MEQRYFGKIGQAASALALAAALAVSAGTSFAQDKKIVPFLTAESSPESVQQILELIAEFEEQNPDTPGAEHACPAAGAGDREARAVPRIRHRAAAGRGGLPA